MTDAQLYTIFSAVVFVGYAGQHGWNIGVGDIWIGIGNAILGCLMSFSWGLVSGCFIGPYIWGLFSKKITKIGAWAGILAGLLTVGGATLVITLNSNFSATAAKSPEMGVAAMAISLIVVPVVSALTKNKDQERVEEIFTCYEEE